MADLRPAGRSPTPVRLALLLFCAAALARPAFAQTEPIRYIVSFPAPHTHYVEVEASYPTDGRAHIDLMMAVWTPGSYLIREYARHVEGLSAADSDDAPLEVDKTRKNRWRVSAAGAQRVLVRYRVYAHEMSVRTNWVDEELALLNGAPTFITLLESRRRPHEIRVVLPRNWARSLSAMPAGSAANTYVAPDYDTLVDSPIVAGTPAIYEFAVSGVPHYLVNFRERDSWDGPRAARDLSRVADAIARFWGTVPFERYYFFNIIGGTVNGLEHKSSTVVLTPEGSTESRQSYLSDWLSIASHEYFHAWNAKRLRPVELGPFDYENEVYTRSLWFVEGVTDYYADLLVHRAGVSSRDEYLAALGAQIRSLQTTPGRLVQSAEMASYDAWIKYYRPDENSPNTAISYYVKGAVVAFLLDARLRRATGGTRSLDDVMRTMFERFSGDRGFTPEDLRATIAEVAGPASAADVRARLERALTSTDELEYAPAMEWFGLRLAPGSGAPDAWLGVATRTDGDRTLVSQVRRGSPAAAAGVSVGDEIVAVDGQEMIAGPVAEQLARRTPGASIVLTISRRGERRDLTAVLGPDPGHAWSLGVSPSATDAQRTRLQRWLTGER